jgi:hypothetical protein
VVGDARSIDAKEIILELPDVANAVGAGELENEVDISEATLEDGVELVGGPLTGFVRSAMDDDAGRLEAMLGSRDVCRFE